MNYGDTRKRVLKMTDRYLFRGKRKDTKEWIYGGVYYQKKDAMKDEAIYIITGSLSDIACAVEVIPETVGQYIGRSDKNKKKIFEGDILLTDCWHTLLVVYFDEDYLQFRVREVVSGRENSIDYYDNSNNVKIEVVGNIYDNPELLEVQR